MIFSLSAFDIVESRGKEMWLVSYTTCIDIIALVSLTPES